jgi:hypothetical protein
MNQEDELIRENDKAMIINTHNAVQALQERVDSITIELYPEEFVMRLKELASDIDNKRDK